MINGMKNDNDVKIECCSSSVNLVSYLYDEMNPDDRAAFETHLAGCGGCTDEFADLSFARLDVYEWHRDEFAGMETPRIVIPYADTEASVSWLDGFRTFFASHGRLAVSGAFALIAVVFAAMFVSSLNKTDETVLTLRPEIPAINVPPVEPALKPAAERTGDKLSKPDSILSENLRQDAEPQIIRAAARKNLKSTNTVDQRQINISKRSAKQPVQAQRGKAPRLNDFEEEDDNTLRLGDLLADVDTRD